MKGCYEQTVHSTDILSLKRLVNYLPAIIRMIDTIQHMSHMVRMTYGDSNLTYRGYTIPNEFKQFVMVLYQVNCSAHQIRWIISSVVFLVL